MKLIFSIILIITSFFEQLGAIWGTIFQEKKIVYISSSLGDDRNSGTINAPLRTIASLSGNNKKNVSIRLKRGDIFFESIVGFEDCDFDSYGEGECPILCGFKILKNQNKWEPVSSNVWRLDVKDKSNFYGFGQNLSSVSYGNIGIVYDVQKDVVYGNMVKSKSELKRNGDFFVSDCLQKKIEENDFKWLYFYWRENPSKLGHLCFSVAESAVRGVINCKIKNISFVGYGIHGVNLSKNSELINCKIDLIGGTLHHAPYFLRLGNGVQVWVAENVASENVLVSNCQITRTYDCGTTIQGSNTIGSRVFNICFKNNVIAYCRQGFERYLNPASSSAQYENCEFTDNILFKNGDNHFGMNYMENNVHLLSYEQTPRVMNISRNIMYGGNLQFVTSLGFGIENNNVYIYKNQYLLNVSGNKHTIVAMDEERVAEYKKECKDDSNIIILNKDSDDDLKIRGQLEERMNLSYPKLDFGYLYKE